MYKSIYTQYKRGKYNTDQNAFFAYLVVTLILRTLYNGNSACA